jgi:hypothetical protein
MKYYKSADGEVFAYAADGSEDAFIRVGLVLMSESEVMAHLNPASAQIGPRSITMRQARLLLHSRNMLTMVQEAIDSLDEPPRIAAQIEWDYSSTMERNKPFVAMIAGHIGLTDEDLDAMFIEAATL